MNVPRAIVAGLRDITRELFMTQRGRVIVAVAACIPVVIWLIGGRQYGILLVLINIALAPVWLILWTALFQFLAGFVFALVHRRRPKHSYVMLDLKDGRQRRGMVCMAPCCVRRKIRGALRTDAGGIQWSLGDGSDNERFGRDEIKNWVVIPVDNPDPHSTHG